MIRAVTTLLVLLVLTAIAVPAIADWDPPDGHKMHFPQLPDPNGWDVDVTAGFVADDWQCSWTGPVDDIHFWISAKGDNLGNGIDFIEVRIFNEVAAGTDPDPLVTWSHPGNELWFSKVEDFAASGDVFTIREPLLLGDQGWYSPEDPPTNYAIGDHDFYAQINIENIVNPY